MQSILSHSFRKFKKQPGYSLLNLVGLAMGVGCTYLLFLYVWQETSFDKFEGHENIYRLGSTYNIGGNIDHFCNASRPIGPTLSSDFSHIQTHTRVAGVDGLYTHQAYFEYDQKQVMSNQVFYADSTFFDVFPYQLMPGSSQTPLHRPKSLVLSEELVTRIFGNQNAIGKTVDLDGTNRLTITGIIAKPDFHTHLPVEAITSWDIGARPGENERWIGWHVYTYLKFDKPQEKDAFDETFEIMSSKYMSSSLESLNAEVLPILQPISSIHLNSNLSWEAYPNNQWQNVYIFILVGSFLMLIALINYVNLATARSGLRAKEIGIKKVMGSTRKELMTSIMLESILTVFASAVTGLLLIVSVLAPFNELAGVGFHWQDLFSGKNLVVYLGITILIGLIAGSYPALQLSGLSGAKILRGSFQTSNRGVVLRKALVVIQFLVSIALIASTTVVMRQMNFVESQNLGFNKNNLMVIELPLQQSKKVIESFARGLSSHSGIVGATLTRSVPGIELNLTFYEVPDEDGDYYQQGIEFMEIDPYFMDLVSMELADGRNFLPFSEKDQRSSLLLNETAAREYGWEGQAVGKKISFGTDSLGNRNLYEVIGVVRDFHVGSFHSPIQPIAIFQNFAAPTHMLVRLQGPNIRASVDYITTQWKEYDSQNPMEYTFLDQNYQKMYEAEQNIFTLLKSISFITLLLSGFGLLGLVAFSLQVRKREISIRRVLGSTPLQVNTLLGKEYLIMLGIAFVAGSSISFYFLQGWLNNFHYRIALQGWEFALSLFLVLLLVATLLFFVTRKTISQNPGSVLRSE
ncbi:MAG: ABC transporter permease [Bacteroidota bacterium]